MKTWKLETQCGSLHKQAAAVILAAGLSSRTTDFKPLLPLSGTSVLQEAIGSLRGAGINNIVLVVGHRAREVARAITDSRIKVVYNDRFTKGMYSSIQTGVERLPADTSAFFVFPVDHPGVRPETLGLLWRTWLGQKEAVVYPTYHGARGHPPLIPGPLRRRIMSLNPAGGLRELLRTCAPEFIEVETKDEGVALDIDTDAAHRELKSWLESQRIPSLETCRTMLCQALASPAELARSEAACRLALAIGEVVNRSGLGLNLPLVRAAALLAPILSASSPGGAEVSFPAAAFPRLARLLAEPGDESLPGVGLMGERELLSLVLGLTLDAQEGGPLFIPRAEADLLRLVRSCAGSPETGPPLSRAGLTLEPGRR